MMDLDAVKEASKPNPPTPLGSTGKLTFSKRTQWRQWLAGISATLSMVAAGTVYGWTTTSLPRLQSGGPDVPVTLTPDEGSWLVSLTVIGSMIGPFLGAALADRCGRKRCLLISSGFYMAGWLIVLFAKTAIALYVARVILGVGVGMSYTTNPMYVSEVADVNIRGALGTLIAVNVFTGSLLTCSVGPYVSYQVLVAVLLAVPVFFVACFVWFPETPHFLAARGRRAEASRALAFFKGIRDRDEARRELDLALRGLPPDDPRAQPPPRIPAPQPPKHNWPSKLRMLLLPANGRALGIVLGLITAQQLSGNFSTMQFLSVLFNETSIGIDSDLATILVLAVGLVSCGFATATVEGAGRRPLLIVSTLGSALSLAVLAVHLMLGHFGWDLSSVKLLPVATVIVFQIAFQIGLGTLPSALIGELFPTEVKAAAGAIVIIVDGVLGFAVTKMYQVIGDELGAYTVYYFFAAACFLAFVMVAFLVPETKGRSFSEIRELLAGGRRGGSVAREKMAENGAA